MIKSVFILPLLCPCPLALLLQVPTSTWRQMLVGREMTTPEQPQISMWATKAKSVLLPTMSKPGPAIVIVDGADTETEFSGKAGIGLPVSEAIGVYGEVSFLTAEDEDDFGVGGKLGVKYNF